MDVLGKVVTGLMFIALIAVIWYRYDQYVLAKNYMMLSTASCDPAFESCFAADCEGLEETECDTTPYAKVTVLAADAPQCLFEHSCEDFSCEGKEQCEFTYCAEDTLEEGEICVSTPEEPPQVEIEATLDEPEESVTNELL